MEKPDFPTLTATGKEDHSEQQVESVVIRPEDIAPIHVSAKTWMVVAVGKTSTEKWKSC